MAKTIKFSLKCDGQPVRTIDDLQENFNIEDVLAYYRNDLLAKWLKVRGYEDELKQISLITATDDVEIIKELAGIFEVYVDEKEIAEVLSELRAYEEKKQQKEQALAEEKESHQAVSKDGNVPYWFEVLIDDMIRYHDEAGLIETKVVQLISKIKDDNDFDSAELYSQAFWKLKDKSPLAIMRLLMHNEPRSYYLPYADENLQNKKEKVKIYQAICSMIKEKSFEEKIGENLRCYSGIADGKLKLFQSIKRHMIISVSNDIFLYERMDSYKSLSKSDIKNKFLIFDGFHYRGIKGSEVYIEYMEL